MKLLEVVIYHWQFQRGEGEEEVEYQFVVVKGKRIEVFIDSPTNGCRKICPIQVTSDAIVVRCSGQGTISEENNSPLLS